MSVLNVTLEHVEHRQHAHNLESRRQSLKLLN